MGTIAAQVGVHHSTTVRRVLYRQGHHEQAVCGAGRDLPECHLRPDGACDEAWVDVVVIPTNDAPTGVADTAAIDEGGTVHIDVLANDLDPDSPLDYDAVTLVSTPASALVVVVTDGLLVTHDGFEPMADGFVYRVCDPEGLCGDAEVVLQVVGVNDPPQAVPDAIAVDEGTETTFDPRANDLDPTIR